MTPLISRSLFTFAFILSIFASLQSNAEYYTCYEQEYRCETRYEQDCRQERSCHTVPGQRQCSQERVCKTRTEPGQCETVEECGTNALGQPICKPRQHCSGGGTVEECGNVERCYDSGSREECSYHNVCDSRPLDRCGYETISKTCYRPDPIPVDPTPIKPPPVDPWPVDPIPVDPTPIDPTPVDPWPVDPVPVDPTPIDPIPVDPTPVDPAPELGPNSIQKLNVIVKEVSTTLIFKDMAQSLTYRTRYFISVYDSTGELIINQFSSDKGENQKIVLNKALSTKKRYKLVIRVQRSGGELVRDVEFTKSLDF